MESTAAAASAARLREALCARAPVRVLSMPAFRYTEMDCGKSAWWRGKHPFFKHYFLFSKLTSSDFSEKCFNIPMNGSQQISITGIAELHFPPFTCFFFAASNYFPQIGCFCIRVKENAGAFCRKLSYCGSEGQENVQPSLSAGRHSLLLEFTCGAHLVLSALIDPHGFFSLE